MEPMYMNGKGVAKVGDVVMTSPGTVRAIVIGINGTFVKVLGIGIRKDTGDTVVLNWVHDMPASDCVLLEKQTLNL